MTNTGPYPTLGSRIQRGWLQNLRSFSEGDPVEIRLDFFQTVLIETIMQFHFGSLFLLRAGPSAGLSLLFVAERSASAFVAAHMSGPGFGIFPKLVETFPVGREKCGGLPRPPSGR